MDILKKFLLAKQEITHQNSILKLKTALFVSFAAVIFFSIVTAVVYFLGYTLLLDKGVESQSEMARTLAASVDSAIEKQAELLRLNANSQVVVDALKQDNLKYRAMGEKETQRYLMDMDKRWIQAPVDHPILEDYLENKLSLNLKGLKKDEEKLVSVMVTDKFGGLAGSTTRPSGFYSFDQDWWRNSYANGHGKLFVGGVEYDEASNLWCLPFAVPIEDETGAVVGICKAQVSLDAFFKPLLNFKIGRTGNAVLADNKAYLLYHPKATPFANKFCEYGEFQNALQNSDKWGILDSAYLNRGKKLVAYAEVSPSQPQAYFYTPPQTPQNSFLSGSGINWFVFVERDLKEIISPLNKLIFIMIVIGIALAIILALSVFILSAQEPPNYSMLQVIKDAPAQKSEDKDSGHEHIEERAKRLPEEK